MDSPNIVKFTTVGLVAEFTNSSCKTLNKGTSEPKIKLSGKVFTDDAKLEEKDYLSSVEGAQINIEGKLK